MKLLLTTEMRTYWILANIEMLSATSLEVLHKIATFHAKLAKENCIPSLFQQEEVVLQITIAKGSQLWCFRQSLQSKHKQKLTNISKTELLGW